MSAFFQDALRNIEAGWPTVFVSKRARILLQMQLQKLQGATLQFNDKQGSFSVGTGPLLEINVHDVRFYPWVLFGGDIGAGGAYIRGYWDASDLTGLFRILSGKMAARMDTGRAVPIGWYYRLRHGLNANTLPGSARNIRAHYDVGNDFFSAFLDPTMSYSAAVYEPPDCSLEEASKAKMAKVCRLLELGPADHVLEIGCGWGGFAVYAACNHGCKVTAVTLSKAQYEYTRRRVSKHNLSAKVEVLNCDYRHLCGRYDKLVSIEMIEAVGHRYMSGYFRSCARLLEPHGRFFLQAIVMPDQGYERYLKGSDYIRHYIFPGSNLPSIGSIIQAAACHTDFCISHIEDIGLHYARTLAAWDERLHSVWGRMKTLGYSEELLRAWHYYFCYCRAGFLEQRISDVQMLLERRPLCVN